MCFEIPSKQTPWTTPTVRKVMFIEDNLLFSPHYAKNAFYKIGETIECHSDDYTRPPIVYEKSWYFRPTEKLPLAKAGIYVWSHYLHALSYANTLRYQGSPVAIIDCEVEPQDFLYHDESLTMATYKKVKFAKLTEIRHPITSYV
jgi:hypothetical protein